MKQADLEREVARATGESVSAVQRFGFSLETPLESFDLEMDAREPQFIDWDALDSHRYRGSDRRMWHAPTAA